MTDTLTLKPATETTVTTTPIKIAPADPDRRTLIIQNLGNAPARIGDPTLTPTTGSELPAGQTRILNGPTNAVYATRSGPADTTVLTQAIAQDPA